MKSILLLFLLALGAVADSVPEGPVLVHDRYAEVVETKTLNAGTPLVLILVEANHDRYLVAVDPFTNRRTTRWVGQNFVNLSSLISPDGKYLVRPLGYTGEFEVYKIDGKLLDSLKAVKPIWAFKIVSLGASELSMVQLYGGWKDDSFSVGLEIENLTGGAWCRVSDKSITPTGEFRAMKAKEREVAPSSPAPVKKRKK